MTAVSKDQRHSKRNPCPVCEGAEQDARGQGKRCTGFTSADGDWCHCSREELAGAIPQNNAGIFAHLMHGPCNCGRSHGPARTTRAEPERTYDYHDEARRLLYQVVRLPGKRFRQRKPDGNGGWEWRLGDVRRVPYRLPDLLEADTVAPVLILEGEKDVETARTLGFVATCNAGGAGKWSGTVAETARKVLAGRDIIVVRDADEVGRKHAEDVRRSLYPVAKALVVVECPDAKDFSDYVAAGGTRESFLELSPCGAEHVEKPAEGNRTNRPKPARETESAPHTPDIEPGEPGWSGRLLRISSGRNRGSLRQVAANVAIILVNDHRWAGVLAYDDFAEAIVLRKPAPWGADFVDPKHTTGEWLETDTTRLQAWMGAEYGLDVGSQSTIEAVKVAAGRQRFHPVREWLEGLKWDGTRRVPSFLVDYFGADDTPYTRFVGASFLVAAVARIMSPGCKVDTVPILEGGQGMGKSSALRALVPDEWFLEFNGGLEGAEAMKLLRRKWIVELPELDALSKAEISKAKAFFSAQVDTYRPSYGKTTQDFPRQTAFVGTTNAASYLKDETGARRYFPVLCRRALKTTHEERAQLWAEALARFQGGEEWHTHDPEILDACAEQQDARFVADDWESKISEWLAKPSDIGPSRAERGVTTGEILEYAIRLEVGKIEHKHGIRAAAVLRRLGWERGGMCRRNGAKVRPYYPSPLHQTVTPMVTPMVTPQSAEDLYEKEQVSPMSPLDPDLYAYARGGFDDGEDG